MGKYSQQIRWDITQSVTTASVFYFFCHAAKACLLPFLTLYFQKLGLTATQSGIVTGSKAIIWFFTAPLWTVASRRFRKTKVILGIAILFSIASNLSLTVVAPVDQEYFVNDCVALPTVKSSVLSEVTVQSSAITLNPSEHQPTKVKPSTSQSEYLHGHTTKFNTQKNGYVDELVWHNFSVTSHITAKASPNLLPAPKATSISTTMTTILPTTRGFSTTTTTTKETIGSQMARLAKVLLPRIISADPQSDSDVKRLLLKYRETRHLGRWKLNLLTQSISNLLDEQADENEVLSTTTAPTTHFGENIQDLAEYLLPFYERQKSRDHSLTISEFLSGYPRLDALSSREKAILVQYIFKLQNESFSKSKRSLTLTGNQLSSNFSNQTFAQLLESEIVSSTRQLIDEVMPNLTSNMFTFVMVLFIVIAGEIFSSPIELLSDESFYELLDELDSLNRYGRHKMAALVGTILAGISVSVAVYFSPCYLAGSITRFNIHFYAFAALLGLVFLLVPFYPTYVKRSDQAKRSQAVNLCPCCHARLCSDCRRFLLVLTLLLVGIMQAGVQDFLLWQIKRLPNSSELVFGSYVSASALTSLLAIPVGSRITSRYRAIVTVPTSLLVVSSQLLLCSFVNNAWLIVPLQLFNVIGMPFLWVVVGSELKAMTSWNDEYASVLDQVHVFAKSSHRRATYIAYLCLYQGLAFAIGSVISGVAYDTSGGSLIPFLRIGAAVVGCWACLFLFFHCCCIKKATSRKYSKLLDDGSGDEVETFNLKDRNRFSKKKKHTNYLENGRNVAESRKKRRNKQVYDMASSTDDELERDWLKMNARKNGPV